MSCVETTSHDPSPSRPLSRLLEDGLHHLIAHLGRFGEPGCEVLLDPLEAVAVGLEVAKGHAVRPRLCVTRKRQHRVTKFGL